MGEGSHIYGRATRDARRDTDRGLNKAQLYTISRLEAQIRNRKTEKAYIVDEKGKVIGESIKGTKHSAKVRVSDYRPNAIVTHNHPNDERSGLKGTLAGRIGVPLSPADIGNAVRHNLAEIRAVTPTYTFSIRRPKGGWGDVAKAEQRINQYGREIRAGIMRYAMSQARTATTRQRINELTDRGNVGIQSESLAKLAKQMGWEYTRRRVK